QMIIFPPITLAPLLTLRPYEAHIVGAQRLLFYFLYLTEYSDFALSCILQKMFLHSGNGLSGLNLCCQATRKVFYATHVYVAHHCLQSSPAPVLLPPSLTTPLTCYPLPTIQLLNLSASIRKPFLLFSPIWFNVWRLVQVGTG
uniref:Uncharacterized protein n=1 Tax=Echeneis naucrates TaxID=173247 RepID=A0A665TDM0_ECHNA